MSALFPSSVALLATVVLAACTGRTISHPPPERAAKPKAPSVAKIAKTEPVTTTTPVSKPAPNATQDELPKRFDGMILVPAGPFTMGADSGGEPDEWPAHTVNLPAFYLDENEVTNQEWTSCVEAKICPLPDPANADRNGIGPDKRFRGPKQPVSSVSWDSAQAYCLWKGKRLPTEAEFEKASRGPDGRTYPWGNFPPAPHRAVFGRDVTADVGTFPEGDGPYGHHDLAGNVWEWVEDAYDPFAYRRPNAALGGPATCAEAEEAYAELRNRNTKGFTGSNPIPTECERVLRGGGFNYHAFGLRSTNRVHHPPRYRMVMSGVRCARNALRQTLDASVPGDHGREP